MAACSLRLISLYAQKQAAFLRLCANLPHLMRKRPSADGAESVNFLDGGVSGNAKADSSDTIALSRIIGRRIERRKLIFLRPILMPLLSWSVLNRSGSLRRKRGGNRSPPRFLFVPLIGVPACPHADNMTAFSAGYAENTRCSWLSQVVFVQRVRRPLYVFPHLLQR
jgi:hypothetical protein